MAGPSPVDLSFGRIVVQPAARRLLLDGQPCAVGARAFDVLMALVDRRDRVVSKNELLAEVWPGLVVEENNLQVHISALRKVLGAPAIATVPGRGYRFTLQGATGPSPAADPAPQGAPAQGIAPAAAASSHEPAAATTSHEPAPATTSHEPAPAATSAEPPPGNLPQTLTSFIGRDGELAETRRLLARTRLLTLTGAGGCGKTRLALEAVAPLQPRHPDGVWFVELGALADPALVPQAIANVFGLREQAGQELRHLLARHLRGRRALVVLDSAEHLLAACADLVEAALKHCPDLVMLVTSRQALGVAGELTYRVPSLQVPDADGDVTPAALAACDSARLFVERAQLHQPRFALTTDNAAALASLCRRLDGIPLALELAAARLRSMSVEEIEERLDQRFRLLTHGSRTALPRQQTLRALIDWSYQLLTPPEQALLDRLSVFAGGWTLAAAQRVCSDDAMDAWQVLDLLDSLADKSVVVAEERGHGTRYRLLETVRAYARERLDARGEAARWRQQHLACFAALAEESEPHLTDADQQAWLDRLEPEHDNLRAALQAGCGDGGDAPAALRLAGALWRFWSVRGHLTEGRTWLAAVLALQPAAQDPAARAKALQGAGAMARLQGDLDAAQAHNAESLAIRRGLGDVAGVAASLVNLGITAHDRGDLATARPLYEEGLAAWRAAAHPRGIASALGNLGALAEDEGRHADARALLEESLALSRTIGDWWGIAIALTHLARVAAEAGDVDAGRRLTEEALAIRHRLGDRRGIAESLEGLAWLEFQRDGPARAARRWGAAERLRELIGAPLSREDRARQAARIAAVRDALADAATFDREWQAGRRQPLDPARWSAS